MRELHIGSAIVTGVLTLLTCGACSSVPVASSVAGPGLQEDAGPGVPKRQFTFVGGARTLDDWNDIPIPGFPGETIELGDHTYFGFEFNSIGPSGWGWEMGILFSNGDDDPLGVSTDLTLVEIPIGGRYTYTKAGRFMPYIGGGVDLVFASVDVGGLTADTEDIGFYLHGGANYLIGNSFTLGADVRGLFGTDDELDYVQYGIGIGWAL